MKKAFFIISLLFTVFTIGQNLKEVNLIKVDSTWGKEIIKIPFWFAPEIKFKGVEDIRFAKGWEDIESDGFWVLAFAWDINLKTKPTAAFFEENLKLYYDGLMKVVNEKKDFKIPKTNAFFVEKKSGFYYGTVDVYDAFTTKKVIKLYVTIESFYCTKSKKHLPLFKFSPKKITHKSWEQLAKINLQPTFCL